MKEENKDQDDVHDDDEDDDNHPSVHRDGPPPLATHAHSLASTGPGTQW